jgi:hypothetical protein
MNWSRLCDAVSVCLALCWFGAMFVLLSAESKFAHDPQVVDRVTGHVIPLTLRGVGTVYLTVSEWATVAPYQNAAYFFFGAFFVLLVGRMAAEGYQGFVREWRKSN